MAELAKNAGMSITKFRSSFHSLYGNNVFAHSQEKRMQLAYQLLIDNYLSIKEIAQRCGYEYASHFNTAFKKRFGFTAYLARQHSGKILKK